MAWVPKDKYGRNLLDFTQSRDKNDLVLHLGQLFATEGINAVTNEEVQQYVEAIVVDFNCRIATKAEVKKWRDVLDSICSRGASRNCLSYIMQGLFTQLRTFHDVSEYSDFGEAKERKLVVGGQQFANKNALKAWIVTAIKDQAKDNLDKPMDPTSIQYKVILEVLKRHPRADDKLRDMVGLSVGKNPKNMSQLVIVIMREDPEQNEDISFGKCLPHLPDPSHDPVRKTICDQIFHFFQYYKSSHAHTLLAAAKEMRPPPEFMRSAAGGFQDAMGSNDKIQGYLKGLLILCEMTAPVAAKPQQNGVSLDSLDYTSVHWGLKNIVFEYLHAMEMEREGTEKDETDEHLEELWLNAEIKKLVAVITDRTGRYSAEDKQEAMKLAHNRDGLRALFRQLKTEADISPVLIKLDEAFSNTLTYLVHEMETKKDLVMRRTTYAKHYGAALIGQEDAVQDNGSSSDLSFNSAEVKKAAPIKAWSDDSGSSDFSGSSKSPAPMPQTLGYGSDLGLLSDTSSDARSSNSGTRKSDDKDAADVNVISVFYRLYLPVFRDICLRSTECKVLPMLFFRLVNVDFADFHVRFLSEMFDIVEGENLTDCQIRAVYYIVGFCCRAKNVNAASLITALLRLLQPIKQGVLALEKLRLAGGTASDKVSGLRTAVFTGCLEILAARWAVLHDEADVENIIRVIFTLASIDISSQQRLVKDVHPLVCQCVAKRLMDFDLAVCEPVQQFVERISQRGSKAQVGDQWPERPFDSVPLHRFHGLVHQPYHWYDWQADISTVLESPESETRVKVAVEKMVSIWEEVELKPDSSSVSTAPLNFKLDFNTQNVPQENESSVSSDDEEIDKLENTRDAAEDQEHVIDPPGDEEDEFSPAPIEEVTADPMEQSMAEDDGQDDIPPAQDEVPPAQDDLSPAQDDLAGQDDEMVEEEPVRQEIDLPEERKIVDDEPPLVKAEEEEPPVETPAQPQTAVYEVKRQLSEEPITHIEEEQEESSDEGTIEETPAKKTLRPEAAKMTAAPQKSYFQTPEPPRASPQLVLAPPVVDTTDPQALGPPPPMVIHSEPPPMEGTPTMEETSRPSSPQLPSPQAPSPRPSSPQPSSPQAPSPRPSSPQLASSPPPTGTWDLPTPPPSKRARIEVTPPTTVPEGSPFSAEIPHYPHFGGYHHGFGGGIPSGPFVTIPLHQPPPSTNLQNELVDRFLTSQDNLVKSMTAQQDRLVSLMSVEHQKLMSAMSLAQVSVVETLATQMAKSQEKSLSMIDQVSRTNETIAACLGQLTTMVGFLTERLVTQQHSCCHSSRANSPLIQPRVSTTEEVSIESSETHSTPCLELPATIEERPVEDTRNIEQEATRPVEQPASVVRPVEQTVSVPESIEHATTPIDRQVSTDKPAPKKLSPLQEPQRCPSTAEAEEEKVSPIQQQVAEPVVAPAVVEQPVVPPPPPPPPQRPPPPPRKRRRQRPPSPEPLLRRRNPVKVEGLVEALIRAPCWPDSFTPVTSCKSSSLNADQIEQRLAKLEADANAF